MTTLLEPSVIRAGGKPPPFADESEAPNAPEEDTAGEEREDER
jgi:hypothetical protein